MVSDLAGTYDIMMIGHEPVPCSECREAVHACEIVFMRGMRAPGSLGYMTCLACAEKAGCEPVPVGLVAKSSRMLHKHYAHALVAVATRGAPSTDDLIAVARRCRAATTPA